MLNKPHSSSEGDGGHGEDHEHAPAARGEVPAQGCQSGRVRNTMKAIPQVSLCGCNKHQGAEGKQSLMSSTVTSRIIGTLLEIKLLIF